MLTEKTVERWAEMWVVAKAFPWVDCWVALKVVQKVSTWAWKTVDRKAGKMVVSKAYQLAVLMAFQWADSTACSTVAK